MERSIYDFFMESVEEKQLAQEVEYLTAELRRLEDRLTLTTTLLRLKRRAKGD